MQLCRSLSILWHCLSLGLEWKVTFSSPVATAEFSKCAGILSAALSQHHLSGFGISFIFSSAPILLLLPYPTGNQQFVLYISHYIFICFIHYIYILYVFIGPCLQHCFFLVIFLLYLLWGRLMRCLPSPFASFHKLFLWIFLIFLLPLYVPAIQHLLRNSATSCVQIIHTFAPFISNVHHNLFVLGS